MALKQLLFTFDYELFLGKRSGSARKCIIDPTDKLLTIFRNYGLKAIFFVDTVYLLRLEEIAVSNKQASTDLELIKFQIRQITKDGHYVFPHIHPSWMDAVYLPEFNQWDLSNTDSYRFHSLNDQKQTALFDKSVEILRTILSPIGYDYKPIGYRAGGWCIQPFEDFKPHFEKHGIKYDFSVLKGDKFRSSFLFYDFSNTFSGPDIYSFSSDVTVPDSKGNYTEFCISMIEKPSYIKNFLNRIYMKMIPNWYKSSSGNGFSAEAKNTDDSVPEKVVKKREMISMELLTRAKLDAYFGFIESNNYMHFISHPKMLSQHNLVAFKLFLSKVTVKYKLETDFRKMV
ncbi:MAG TPA: hypothetical protein VGO45_14480 [Bacteroidia bacterium]|jgi:hypothetical protein|nr:hypothetical protein [Bacteroidia bacterium]